MHNDLIVLGWRELIGLPDLQIPLIRAKIDTGARSSALHVDSWELFSQDGQEWVRFSIAPGDPRPGSVHASAKVLDRRVVTDSGGHQSERIFIKTRVSIKGQVWPIEVNLADRRNMRFPMLLGRTAMNNKVIVDPSLSFNLGEEST